MFGAGAWKEQAVILILEPPSQRKGNLSKGPNPHLGAPLQSQVIGQSIFQKRGCSHTWGSLQPRVGYYLRIEMEFLVCALM